MTEKVVISQEQAKAIEELLVIGNEGDVLVKHANRIAGRGYLASGLMVLNNMPLPVMARALYIGYEIEKLKFQPGDKVIWTSRDEEETQFLELDRIREDFNKSWWCTDEEYVYENQIRHATQEEIFWYETLSRDAIGDFRLGDVYRLGGGRNKTVDQNTKIDLLKHSYASGNLIGIYPVESFQPIPKEDKK